MRNCSPVGAARMSIEMLSRRKILGQIRLQFLIIAVLVLVNLNSIVLFGLVEAGGIGIGMRICSRILTTITITIFRCCLFCRCRYSLSFLKRLFGLIEKALGLEWKLRLPFFLKFFVKSYAHSPIELTCSLFGNPFQNVACRIGRRIDVPIKVEFQCLQQLVVLLAVRHLGILCHVINNRIAKILVADVLGKILRHFSFWILIIILNVLCNSLSSSFLTIKDNLLQKSRNSIFSPKHI